MYVIFVSPEYYRNRQIIAHEDYDRPIEEVYSRRGKRDIEELVRIAQEEKTMFLRRMTILSIKRARLSFANMVVRDVWYMPKL